MSMGKGDVAGYRNRAPGGKYYYRVKDKAPKERLTPADQINNKLVAQWSKANLEDLCGMFICSKEPKHTAGTFAGNIYWTMYSKARRHHPEGLIPVREWQEIISTLNYNERKALIQVGQFIPASFHGDSDH